MKTSILFLLTIYQRIGSPLLHQLLGQKNMCRYEKSCSEYAKEVIGNHGVLQGSFLAVKRLLSCSSFTQSYATNH